MGIFENLFGKSKGTINKELRMISGYVPAFTTREGGLYEIDLTRAVIANFARHCSKLKPETIGPGNEGLRRMLQNNPNPFMTTPVFLSRVATIYEIHNTVVLIPIEDKLGRVTGIYPILPSQAVLKEYQKELYVVYEFNGVKGAIEFSRCGIMSQHNYKDDLVGTPNYSLNSTLDVLNTQNQGMIEAIKSSAVIRFMARVAGQLKPKDLEAKQRAFSDANLSSANTTGVMVYDDSFEDVKQVEPKPYVIEPKQISSIKDTVYTYFGTNDKILQNSFSSTEWNAYYEGKIEPFAIQLGIVLTNMLFTSREKGFGNEIIITSNRMQYLSNAEKLSTVVQLFDRGFLTHNQGCEIFNLAPRENGDKYYIRKEYIEYNKLDKEEGNAEIITDENSGTETVQSTSERNDQPGEDEQI